MKTNQRKNKRETTNNKKKNANRKMQNKIIENDKQEKSQELGKRSSASCKQVASIFVII